MGCKPRCDVYRSKTHRCAANAVAVNLCRACPRRAGWSRRMIWHIFKKDLRITWPLAVLVAAVDWRIVLLALIGGISGPALPVVNFLRMLTIGGPLASGLLIIVAVH